jgi:predicted PurR-regulated permease PerM
MADSKHGKSVETVLVAAAIVAALYFGREVLLPIALAVLLSFVLAPLARFLQRLRLPRLAAVLVSVLLAFAVISAVGTLMFSQVSQLAGELPRYQTTLNQKIKSLRGAATASGTLEQASRVLENLQRELDRPEGESPAAAPPQGEGAPAQRPIPVEVHQPDPGALQTLATLIAPLVHPLVTSGLIVIFVVFILLQQQELRNRLIRIGGLHDLHRTTLAMDDAGQRLSRLFLMQLALNGVFGLIIGVGLWLIGVPSAALWGILAMALRFVPYVGAIAAAIFPLIMATAVDPGWSMTVMTAALFLVTEPLIGQVVEPMIYGHSSGLSPVAVVASATFWTWLWGPIGLILATPLTMCLVVLGRHVERLEFLDVLLGNRPALAPSETAYQRMLAGDPIELIEQAETFLKEKTLADYFEEILMSGLRLAWVDLQRGRLEQEQMRRVRDTVAELVQDLEAHEDATPAQPAAEADGPLARLTEVERAAPAAAASTRYRFEGRVLCVPGRGLLDEAVAMPLAELLRREGIPAEAKQAETISVAKLFALDTDDVALVCLCYLEHATPAQLQYASRRLRRQAPGVRILAAVIDGSPQPAERAPPSLDTELMHGPLSAAVKRIAGIMSEHRLDADAGSPPALDKAG